MVSEANYSNNHGSVDGLKKCAIYTRVSTDEQAAKEHNSCEVQEGLCRELIERNRRDGWVAVETFTDQGYTGANIDRPDFRRLLEAIKRGTIQVIAVYRRDRLFRDTCLSAELQAFFDLHNVIVASVQEGITDRAPHARFARVMIDGVAELERLVTLGRVRDAIHARAARGEWKAGIPSFGYSYTPGTKILEVNESEATIVRFIFTSIAEGTSTRELCRELRERRMFGRMGRRKRHDGIIIEQQSFLTTDSIRSIVANQVYRGYLRARNPHAPENISKDHPDAWELFLGKHAKLVDDELWYRANRAIGVPNRDRTVPKERPAKQSITFLVGIVRCGNCQCAMTPGLSGRSSNPNERHAYIRCVRHLRAAEQSSCVTRCLPVAAVEGTVLSFITSAADNPAEITRLEMRDTMERNTGRIAKLKEELLSVESDIQRRQTAVSELVEYVRNGNAKALSAEFVASAEQAKRECSDLELTRARLEGLILKAGAKTPTPGQLSEAFRRVAVGLAGAALVAKREIIHQIFDSISVTRVDTSRVDDTRLPRKRVYRLVMRTATNRLLRFGLVDPLQLAGRDRYADLDFSVTFELFSNKKEQRVHILETNYSLQTSNFKLNPMTTPTPNVPGAPGPENPIQKAYRWEKILKLDDITLTSLAAREGVSKALVSQHIALLQLPQKILSFLREGRDSGLRKPISFRELQRFGAAPTKHAEQLFFARIAGRPLQDEIDLGNTENGKK